MKTLSVLIPIFNESRTIVELIHQLENLEDGVISECIFINDGSTDESETLLKLALKNVTFSYQLINQRNMGKAAAIRAGAQKVKTSHIIILDSDLELETADISRFWYQVINYSTDIVFGYRKFLAHSSFTYRYSRGNQLLSNIYGILFNEVISDIMCGYKLVPSWVLKELPYKYRKFGIEIEVTMFLWKHRQRPFEMEVSYKARNRNDGKSIHVADAFFIILSMFSYRINNSRRKANVN